MLVCVCEKLCGIVVLCVFVCDSLCVYLYEGVLFLCMFLIVCVYVCLFLFNLFMILFFLCSLDLMIV